MYLLQKSNQKASSRRQIDIKSVRDGVLYLSNNCYRMVLEVSSLNFELKSEDEQDALIDTYQSFLNSLGIPLQVLIRVREMDMDKYLLDLETRLASEPKAVFRQQLTNYCQFVRSLITRNKILARHFYVVIPHTATTNDFVLIKEQLSLNCDIVAKGLMRMGMQSRELGSLEILDLFYSFYNPKKAKLLPLSEQAFQVLHSSYIHKGATT